MVIWQKKSKWNLTCWIKKEIWLVIVMRNKKPIHYIKNRLSCIYILLQSIYWFYFETLKPYFVAMEKIDSSNFWVLKLVYENMFRFWNELVSTPFKNGIPSPRRPYLNFCKRYSLSIKKFQWVEFVRKTIHIFSWSINVFNY